MFCVFLFSSIHSFNLLFLHVLHTRNYRQQIGDKLIITQNYCAFTPVRHCWVDLNNLAYGCKRRGVKINHQEKKRIDLTLKRFDFVPKWIHCICFEWETSLVEKVVDFLFFFASFCSPQTFAYLFYRFFLLRYSVSNIIWSYGCIVFHLNTFDWFNRKKNYISLLLKTFSCYPCYTHV